MSDEIPEAVREAADKALNAAWDEHAELFSPHSNTISDGLWKRIVEHIARDLLAEREAMRERCAKIAEMQVQLIDDDGQTMRGLRYRHASEIAQAIRSPHE